MHGRADAPSAPTGRAWLAALALTAACARGPAPLELPVGSGAPLSDPAPIAAALERCAETRALAAEIGLSGRAAGQRLRGTLHAGFSPPDALRLEAVAPFGGPVFVLAGRDDQATLLLTREDRVVRGAPSAILEALVGLRVEPAALRAWIGGCPSAGNPVTRARQVGDGWLAADAADGATLWFRTAADGALLVAEVQGTLTVEFHEHRGGQPSRIRLRQAAGPTTAALDVRLALDQVDRDGTLDPSAFVVDVPASATPLGLDELRAAGPLRDARPES